MTKVSAWVLLGLLACGSSAREQATPRVLARRATDAAVPYAEGDAWRRARRLVDVHTHIDATPEHIAQAVRVMDAVGIGVALNLSGGVVTHDHGERSEFDRTIALFHDKYPGRFIQSMNLDYAEWDSPDFAKKAVAQVEEGAAHGAAGFKEFKRLGLFLRDYQGRLLRIDDARLDPMWTALGRLGLPVSIHVADPKAFWMPFDPTNERWAELKDHPRWWFGDKLKYPSHEELLAALERVVTRHPETSFICVHFGNNAEDLDWVDAQLTAHPNMMIDLAARIPEVGRHNPALVRALFIKHQDRILFATDFQVYDGMTLGSGGNGPSPTEADAIDFFKKHWRFLETADQNFPHMTPIQGQWPISAIDLPAGVLRKVYFANAERVFSRALATLSPPGNAK